MWWLIILLAALLLLLGNNAGAPGGFTGPCRRCQQPVVVKKATERLTMIRCQTVSSAIKCQEDSARLKSSGGCCQSSIRASMKRANVSTSGAMACCSCTGSARAPAFDSASGVAPGDFLHGKSRRSDGVADSSGAAH